MEKEIKINSVTYVAKDEGKQPSNNVEKKTMLRIDCVEHEDATGFDQNIEFGGRTVRVVEMWLEATKQLFESMRLPMELLSLILSALGEVKHDEKD